MNTNLKTASRLLLMALFMFGFGYLLVPIYDILCEVTGLNGKTGVVQAEYTQSVQADKTRRVKVQFVTSVSAGLPWAFRPVVKDIEVVPGVVTSVNFEATNLADTPIFGSAVPSVSPSVASKYLNKTDCFCFVRQRLEAGQKKIMPVAFIVDGRIPKHVDLLTLSYTFFPALKS